MINFYRRIVFIGMIASFLILSCGISRAYVHLGISPSDKDNSPLIGGDITDPMDRVTAGANNSPYWTWIYAESSDVGLSESFYHGIAPACALFENSFDGDQGKWHSQKRTEDGLLGYVTLQFPQPFVLTHFTLASGNDSIREGYGREPTDWKILGSNNGTDWVPIYEYSGATHFTADRQALLYTSFSDMELAASGLSASQRATVTNKLGSTSYSKDYNIPLEAYSWYRLEVAETVGGEKMQLGEWELFGYVEAPIRPMPITNGMVTFPGSVFHMDAGNADSINGGTAVMGDKISTWADTNSSSSAFFRSINDETGDGRPCLGEMTLNQGTPNEKKFPAIYFDSDSASRFLMLDSATEAKMKEDGTAIKTVFLVNQAAEYRGLAGIIGKSSNDYGIRMVYDGDLPEGQQHNLDTVSWRVDANNYDEFSTGGGYYLYNGSATQGKLGNAHLLTAVTGTAATEDEARKMKRLDSDIRLGLYNGGRNYNGYLAEVIAFDAFLTDPELKIVQTYLGSKYGLEMTGTLLYETGGYDCDQFYLANLPTLKVADSGTGGFGVISVAPFSLFSPEPFLPADTVLMVSASTDEAFGLGGLTQLGNGDYAQLWDKRWYIDVEKPAGAVSDLFFGFNADDAMYIGGLLETGEWSLLLRGTRKRSVYDSRHIFFCRQRDFIQHISRRPRFGLLHDRPARHRRCAGAVRLGADGTRPGRNRLRRQLPTY